MLAHWLSSFKGHNGFIRAPFCGQIFQDPNLWRRKKWKMDLNLPPSSSSHSFHRPGILGLIKMNFEYPFWEIISRIPALVKGKSFKKASPSFVIRNSFIPKHLPFTETLFLPRSMPSSPPNQIFLQSHKISQIWLQK